MRKPVWLDVFASRARRLQPQISTLLTGLRPSSVAKDYNLAAGNPRGTTQIALLQDTTMAIRSTPPMTNTLRTAKRTSVYLTLWVCLAALGAGSGSASAQVLKIVVRDTIHP